METPFTETQKRKPEPNSDIRTNGDLEDYLLEGDTSETIEANEEYWNKKHSDSLKRYSENKHG